MVDAGYTTHFLNGKSTFLLVGNNNQAYCIQFRKQNLLYVGNYNKAKFDKTKWYKDYETLEGMRRPSYQNDTTSVSKDTMERIKMIRPIPETTQRLQQRLLTIIYCLLRRLHILTKT